MIGLGTLIDMGAIVLGGLIGLVGERFINERIQETMMKANGLCIVFIGAAGALQHILYVDNGTLGTQGSVVLIGSFAIGTFIGEALNIEQYLEKFGIWIQNKSGNASDNKFLNGFLTASFTVSIGAMAIVGSIEEGMTGDHSVLVTKSMLDFLIIMVMATSMGKGPLFSAIPVGICQGTMTLLARLLEPIMSEAALGYISMTGSILIFCVGVNLIKKDTFRVSNMLPVIVVAVVFGVFGV